MGRAFAQRHGSLQLSSTRLLKRLSAQHPSNRLRQRSQRCDELEMRLLRALKAQTNGRSSRFLSLRKRLQSLSPDRQLQRRHQTLASLGSRLKATSEALTSRQRLRLEGSSRALRAISPLQTLERGYAIAQDQSGQVIRDASTLKPDQPIRIRVARGKFDARISKLVD